MNINTSVENGNDVFRFGSLEKLYLVFSGVIYGRSKILFRDQILSRQLAILDRLDRMVNLLFRA